MEEGRVAMTEQPKVSGKSLLKEQTVSGPLGSCVRVLYDLEGWPPAWGFEDRFGMYDDYMNRYRQLKPVSVGNVIPILSAYLVTVGITNYDSAGSNSALTIMPDWNQPVTSRKHFITQKQILSRDSSNSWLHIGPDAQPSKQLVALCH